MRKASLVMLFLCCSCASFCQNIEKQLQFTLDTAYDIELYRIDRTVFEGKILKVELRDTLSDKLTAEFLRITDSTYFYTKYNEGKALEEGEVIVNSQPLYTLPFSEYDSNGNQSTSYIQLYNFIKNGKWYEQLTDSTGRSGNYLDNKKEGDWIYDKKIDNRNTILTIKEHYLHGQLKTTAKINMLEGSDTALIKETIAGKWVPVFFDLEQLNDSIWSYKKAAEKDDWQKHYWIFFKNGKCEMQTRRPHGSTVTNGTWHFVSGDHSIEIETAGKKKFTITYLSAAMFVLKYSFTE
jgi:hypothetical protein